MSVSGEATEDPQEGNEPESPPEMEGDVPKPAFELPDSREEPTQPAAPRTGKSHRERGIGYAQEARQLRQDLEKERQERQRFAEQLAEMRGQLAERRAPAAGSDPLTEQLKENRRAIENALERMGRGDAQAVNEWHEAREREQRLISRAEAQSVAAEAAKNAPRPLDPVLASVAAKYNWIQTDDDARAIAEANVRRLVRLEGRDMTNPVVRKQTLMQGAAEAERDLGLGDGSSTDANDTHRERFRGIAGQSSGAGRSGKSVVSLNGEQKAQAEALFRHMEPEQAHREWWAKIGAKIANK
jgi:hypothetical protein